MTMKLFNQFIDVAATVSKQQVPGIVVTADTPGTYLVVPKAHVTPGEPVEWTHFKKQSRGFIPCYPYLVHGEPENLMAYGVQVGSVLAEFKDHEVLELHTVVGHPLEISETEEGGRVYRAWLGFGLVIR